MKSLLLSLLLTVVMPLWALTEGTREQVRSAMDRGFAYLRGTQTAEGNWSDKRFPGLSALALWAMARAPRPENS